MVYYEILMCPRGDCRWHPVLSVSGGKAWAAASNSCFDQGSRASTADVANLFAVSGCGNFYRAAHLIQPSTNPFAHSLRKRVLNRRCTRPSDTRPCSRCRIGIQVVRGQHSHSFFVVSSVENMPHRLKRPKRWLARPHIVEHKKFGLQYGLKHAQFRRLTLGVVAVLNLLQQIAVIVENSPMATRNDLLQSGYR